MRYIIWIVANWTFRKASILKEIVLRLANLAIGAIDAFVAGEGACLAGASDIIWIRGVEAISNA